MTLAAPARTRAHAPMIEARPLRNPDASSVEVMTRRGWWLVVLNFLLPGSAQVLAGNRRLGRFGLGATLVMWTVLVLSGLFALLSPSVLFAVATARSSPTSCRGSGPCRSPSCRSCSSPTPCCGWS